MEDFRPLLNEAARVAAKYLMVANFIPWTEGMAFVRREPGGFYLNIYNRQEVYGFARNLGWQVEEVVATLEKDARPNEVVIFTRLSCR